MARVSMTVKVERGSSPSSLAFLVGLGGSGRRSALEVSVTGVLKEGVTDSDVEAAVERLRSALVVPSSIGGADG